MNAPDISPGHVREVVKGLSEAQRDAIRGIYSFASPQEEDEGEMGLYQLGIWKSYRIRSGETHFTPLGLAARALIQQEQEK